MARAPIYLETSPKSAAQGSSRPPLHCRVAPPVHPLSRPRQILPLSGDAFKAFGHSIDRLAHEHALRTGSRPSLYAEDAQIYASRLLTAPSRCNDSGRPFAPTLRERLSGWLSRTHSPQPHSLRK
jgi:hypothetical protein